MARMLPSRYLDAEWRGPGSEGADHTALERLCNAYLPPMTAWAPWGLRRDEEVRGFATQSGGAGLMGGQCPQAARRAVPTIYVSQHAGVSQAR